MSLRTVSRRLLLLGLVALSSGCSRKNDPAVAAAPGAPRSKVAEAAAPAVAPGVPVEVERASIGPIASFLSYNSTLEVETAVVVFPEVGGLVEKILVEEGDRVKAGQPLLQLEHDELEVDLRESEVELKQLEQSFARTKELFERGLVNRQEFDTATFDLTAARLQLERAKLLVEQATVRAPVDGVITERFVQPGARVGASAELFGLMSLDDMIARVYVPGRHLTTVREDQEVYLTSEFLPGKTYRGWVKRISPIVDAASGTFKVTVGIRPGEEIPPPGLFVNVRIVTDRREAAVLVPKRAVLYEGGERYIFVVRDGKAFKLRLEAGYDEGNFVEAVSGVTDGEPIVVLGQNGLKDEAPVRIVNDDVSSTIASPTPPSGAAKTASVGR
ncbi:MAG: efflux RND transporter periplasmic adaptor subunit [Opitutaceae bacterium]